MPRLPATLLALALALLCCQLALASETFTDGEKLFALEVGPTLAQKCFSCHGDDPDDIESDLNLTNREGMLYGGLTYLDVVVPGDAEASFMMKAITREDPDYEMPPKDKDRLTQEQIWSVRDWINAGAPWPEPDRIAAIRDEFSDGVIVQTSGALTEEWAQRHYQPENLWAYQPISEPDIPELESTSGHPIDAFIDRGLATLSLPPAPLADRAALLRRATFDLIGLPPSPEDLSAFLADERPDELAFATVVDRLLADPRYGEQWGRHWLDVVRYADSDGFSNDYERPHAWRYRDYVIRSFNQNKPFDTFVIEQIAGDEWKSDNPDALLATGFLRMGPWEHTSMSVARITRQQFLDDVTNAVGEVFLSHPLQCARCHDHKFDPIPTKDYYRIQAVFATTQFADRDVPFQDYENVDGADEKEDMEKRIAYFKKIRQRIQKKEREMIAKWCEENGLPNGTRNELAAMGIPDEKLPPRRFGLDNEEIGIVKVAEKNIKRTNFEMQKFKPHAMSVYSGPSPKDPLNSGARWSMPEKPLESGDVEQMHILTGGDPFAKGAPVTPGVMSALPGSNDTIEATDWNRMPEDTEGRRLAFAQWIASPRNPLVPRSFVNRVWAYHFGRGIVNTPNNFGAMGAKPTHPELLDYLATRFIESGWDIKALHRAIMLSETYRRSAEHPQRALLAKLDPKGESYAAFAPRRLSAEEIRDSMLCVSGELSAVAGGLPARPEINLDVALQPRLVMGSFAASYEPDRTPEKRNRRSIYAKRVRGLRNPFMEVFNQPSPDESCELRQSSTVTPQVFSLFNSEDSLKRSVATALDLLEQSDNRRDVINELFLRAYGRAPDAEDLRLSLEHWSRMEKRHAELAFAPQELPTVVKRSAVEEMTGASFTFEEKLFAYENYQSDPVFADVDPATRGLAELCLVIFNSNEFVYVY